MGQCGRRSPPMITRSADDFFASEKLGADAFHDCTAAFGGTGSDTPPSPTVHAASTTREIAAIDAAHPRENRTTALTHARADQAKKWLYFELDLEGPRK